MVLEIQMLENLIETVEVISSTDFVNNLESIFYTKTCIGEFDEVIRFTRDLFFCYL